MALSHKRLAVALVAAVIALSLGVLATLSLSAAITALPAMVPVEQLRQGLPMPKEKVQDVARLSFRAGQIFERGRYYSDALLALDRLDPADRARILGNDTMLTLVDSALASSPASPHNWARRASLQLLAGHLPKARASLDTSFALGRIVPGLTVPRLRILLAMLERAPDEALEHNFDEQVRIAARTEPGKLAILGDKAGADGRIQRILSPDFALYNSYLTALIIHRAEAARNQKSTRS